VREKSQLPEDSFNSRKELSPKQQSKPPTVSTHGGGESKEKAERRQSPKSHPHDIREKNNKKRGRGAWGGIGRRTRQASSRENENKKRRRRIGVVSLAMLTLSCTALGMGKESEGPRGESKRKSGPDSVWT